MIANIRVLNEGNFEFLCELDIMRYSQEQVLERMKERGIERDNFFICGFSDWEVDKIMSLDEAYVLKKAIEGLYDGDEFIVKFQLQKHIPINDIVTRYYRFCSKDETEAFYEATKKFDYRKVVEWYQSCSSWVCAFQNLVEEGLLLNTPKGFYRKVNF